VKTKPIQSQSISYCVLRDAYCGKEKGKNAHKFGVYSCSPHEIGKTVISRGKFVVKLKKQSQFAVGRNWRKLFTERVL